METLVALLVAAVCVSLIVSSRVRTGIFPTAGLALMAVGALCELDPWASEARALRLMFIGIVLVSLGVIWRYGLKPWWQRLAMHWDPAHAFARVWGIAPERRSARREP